MGQKRKPVAAEPTVLPVEPPRKRSLLKRIGEPVEAENGTEKRWRNKEKVLILCSRRITFRYRHLMVDMTGLLPHSKRDVKVQCKDNKAATLNELIDLKGCTSCLLFECRKKKDLYMWLSKSPTGPSAKFLVSGVHTMAELKLTGNHLKGSRPLLTFSADFDESPHLQILKELLTQVYTTPKDHRKAKPFYDHVFAFSVVDNHIWFRNYQISAVKSSTEKLDKIDKAHLENMTLIEKKTMKYAKKIKAKQRRRTHIGANQVAPDDLAHVFDEEDE
ncbi:hypothetical protein AXG93_1200s1060 [Marchantia polymorpha subsp. ruderalis]|uniref:Brix domain-containing protein n=1 Tax=Marchantia polymorpha subsp. ruderalis TaxID=1480154 RepID=A0A176WLX1_MARPO|nr:hypothetical protein AXG93_1200s1060 [Marchantia polymorpha subsp. ruderalis]